MAIKTSIFGCFQILLDVPDVTLTSLYLGKLFQEGIVVSPVISCFRTMVFKFTLEEGKHQGHLCRMARKLSNQFGGIRIGSSILSNYCKTVS